MTINDLDPKKSLSDVRFVYPCDGKKYYWISQWEKGVLGKKKLTDVRIYPLFVKNLKECLKWKVVK
jgi:hypothetical protein